MYTFRHEMSESPMKHVKIDKFSRVLCRKHVRMSCFKQPIFANRHQSDNTSSPHDEASILLEVGFIPRL